MVVDGHVPVRRDDGRALPAGDNGRPGELGPGGQIPVVDGGLAKVAGKRYRPVLDRVRPCPVVVEQRRVPGDGRGDPEGEEVDRVVETVAAAALVDPVEALGDTVRVEPVRDSDREFVALPGVAQVGRPVDRGAVGVARVGERAVG